LSTARTFVIHSITSFLSAISHGGVHGGTKKNLFVGIGIEHCESEKQKEKNFCSTPILSTALIIWIPAVIVKTYFFEYRFRRFYFTPLLVVNTAVFKHRSSKQRWLKDCFAVNITIHVIKRKFTQRKLFINIAICIAGKLLNEEYFGHLRFLLISLPSIRLLSL